MYVCIRACVHACMDGWMDVEEAAEACCHCRMQGALPARFSGNLRLLRLLMGDGSGMHAMSGRCHRNKGIIDGIVEWRRR